MRLYPKKLRNIEDLERERKLLLKESRRLEKEDFLSLESILGKNKAQGKGAADNEGSLLDFLPVSNPLVSQVIKWILRRISAKNDKPKEEKKDSKEKKQEKNILASIAKEFVGGYLKWKAIELACKGIKRFIKSRREK